MQRLPFVTYRGQTNRIIYLHENTRNERLMQKKTPITDPLCRSVQCLRPFLIVRPKTLTRDRQNGNLWGEPFHQCESPDPLVAPGRGKQVMKEGIITVSLTPALGVLPWELIKSGTRAL